MMHYGFDQVIHLIARFAPIGRFRKFFYRLRGTRIGKNVYIEDGVFIDQCRPDLVTIEDYVTIAPGVQLFSHQGPGILMRKFLPRIEKPVTIKRGAFIGAGAIILPGVTIGELSVVGAGAVVTKDIPAKSVAIGSPAKVIRHLGEP